LPLLHKFANVRNIFLLTVIHFFRQTATPGVAK
jgi:hypothetical protein